VQFSSYRQIIETPDADLIAQFDADARLYPFDHDFVMAEFHRREMTRASERMETMTSTIVRLTWWVAGLTTLSVGNCDFAPE
jgi:hypothetical protein